MQEEQFSSLSEKIRGSLITPASSEYEGARKVYNEMIDRSRRDRSLRGRCGRKGGGKFCPSRWSHGRDPRRRPQRGRLGRV